MSDMVERYKSQKSYFLKTTASGNIYIHLNPLDNGIMDRGMSLLKDNKVINKNLDAQLEKLKASMRNNFNVPKPEKGKFNDIIDFMEAIKGDTQDAINESDVLADIKTAGTKGMFSASIFDKDSQSEIVQEVEASFMKLMSFPGKVGDTKSRQKKAISNSDLFLKIDGSMKNMQQVLDFYEETIKETKLEFNDAAIQEMVNAYIIAHEGDMKKARGTVFGKAFDKFMSDTNGEMIAVGNGEFRKAEKMFEKFAVRAKTYKTMMDTLASSIGMQRTSNRQWKQRFFQGLSASSATFINQIGGFLHESLVEDMVNISKNGLMQMLSSFSAGAAQVELSPDLKRAMIAEDGKNMTTTMSKEDISLHYGVTQSGGDIELKLKLPGASIKAFTPSGDKYQNIHVRSGASVNEIFALSMKDAKEQQYIIANILSYSGTKGIPVGIKGLAYNYLSMQHTAYALAGTMQKKDTAYLMILNKKVFTVADIIDKMKKGAAVITSSGQEGFTRAQELNVAVSQNSGETIEEAADRRSNMVLDAFLQARMDIELKMLSKYLV